MAHSPQETDLNRVLENLKKSKIPPFYLICGDTFLVKDALHKITDLILPSEGRDLNLFYIDGETESQESIREAVLTPPLIGGTKVIVVQNAEFLRSSTPLPQAISKILNLLESDPAKAARQFIAFLRKTGWVLDDLRNSGWKQMPDAEWKKMMGAEEFEQRDRWLPRIIGLCDQYGLNTEEKDGTAGIEEILQGGMPEGNCLILTSSSVDKRKNVFKLLAEAGSVLDLSLDKGDRNESRKKEMAGALSKEILGRSGKEMSQAALEALGRKTGLDLQKMAGELEKLAAYSGDKAAIDETDVESLINDRPEDSIFSLTGALSERNSSRTLIILEDLLDQGLHPLMILTMVAREVRLLLYAKILLQSDKLKMFHPGMEYPQFQKVVYPVIRDWGRSGKARGELAGAHPYALFHSFKNSVRFTEDECVGSLEKLLDTDIAMKTTGQDTRLLLKKLLIALCSS